LADFTPRNRTRTPPQFQTIGGVGELSGLSGVTYAE